MNPDDPLGFQGLKYIKKQSVARTGLTGGRQGFLGELEQSLVVAAQRALGQVVSAVGLDQLAVGRVVVGERQRRQGLPEALGQSQVLRRIVLELGQLHRVLQDDESVSLSARDTARGVKPRASAPWCEQESSCKQRAGAHPALGDFLVEGDAVVYKQGVGLNVLRVGPGTFKRLVAFLVVYGHLQKTKRSGFTFGF